MRIIDTHLHLIDLERLHYPWLDDERRLKRDHTIDEYLAEAVPLGVEAMLHMEVDVTEADQERETAWVTGIGRGLIGALASCRPEYPTFPAQLEGLAANPKVKGLRRTFHFTPDELPQSAMFQENVRRLAAARLTYDLCALPRQLPIIAHLAAKAPEVQFVLDHCGIPNIKDQELDPWRDHVSALAALPNVACKISGIIAYGRPEGATVEDLKPFVEHVIEAFGWRRLVWGSDWPVCTLTANLTRWVETTHALISGASESEKAALLRQNAIRVYRLRDALQD